MGGSQPREISYWREFKAQEGSGSVELVMNPWWRRHTVAGRHISIIRISLERQGKEVARCRDIKTWDQVSPSGKLIIFFIHHQCRACTGLSSVLGLVDGEVDPHSIVHGGTSLSQDMIFEISIPFLHLPVPKSMTKKSTLITHLLIPRWSLNS